MTYKDKILPYLTEDICKWLYDTSIQRQLDSHIHSTSNAMCSIVSNPVNTLHYCYPGDDWSSYSENPDITSNELWNTIVEKLVEDYESDYIDDVPNYVHDSDNDDIKFPKLRKFHNNCPDGILIEDLIKKYLCEEYSHLCSIGKSLRESITLQDVFEIFVDFDYECSYDESYGKTKESLGYFSPTILDLEKLKKTLSYKFDFNDTIYTYSDKASYNGYGFRSLFDFMKDISEQEQGIYHLRYFYEQLLEKVDICYIGLTYTNVKIDMEYNKYNNTYQIIISDLVLTSMSDEEVIELNEYIKRLNDWAKYYITYKTKANSDKMSAIEIVIKKTTNLSYFLDSYNILFNEVIELDDEKL